MRLIDLKRLSGVDELLRRIREEKGFDDLFINEITVGVTEMFRNPGFWSSIRKNIFPVWKDKSVINIWHAGSSMGEEVYSMAILLKEGGLLEKSRIIGTDINLNALDIAGKGVYHLKHQALNAANYTECGGERKLEDYYRIEGDTVRFDESLIERLEFRRHDLSTEGPFGIYDMIICRNVFIYFNLDLQERVLDLFNQSLKKNSYLGIGSKESIRWCRGAGYFEATDLEENLFRRMH